MNRPTPKKKDAKAIFEAAIEYYMPGQWEAYIVDACGGDEVLRQRVRELLDAHRQTDSFFDKNAEQTDAPPVTERPGTQIGPYKLLQEIGEGGFGVVYMAEQQEPVRRKVALKIIKPGMDTKQVVARFEAERQALALMDHPNIAKVLDAGSTESGRPYFVMELVKGVPVTEYCDKNNLSTSERLSLFIQICRAVQHAHHKGVIHRDIKPSNVMITLHDGEPVPKVIDFGVSKAISQQLTEKTLFTAYGQMIGTPQYMSPEQAEMSGLDVDTRSDVYSLGVLLYELLTGTTPIDSNRLCTLAYVEMQRVIREEEPPRPSARISTMGGELTVLAKHRGTDPKHLTQLLRGDLDWIVMKAMAKERGRRYESPSTFAADIERHLADEATEARPPSTTYQLRRFVRRNKGPVVAAAVVMLVLLLGIAGTTSGLITATRAKGHALKEATRARLAEEAARASEVDARKAEAAARTNLEKSEELSGQLSASVVKLSENASRLAAQRAQTLIEQDRRTEGLHWLGRALELAPAGDSPLTTEIRTTMSVVANELPSPRFVIPRAEDEVFAQTTLSPDGSRIVQLIRADPPAEPQALEARLLDAVTGQLVTSMAVSPETYWVGFSADSRGVYSFDGERLQRWSDKTGTAIGPGIDLSRYKIAEDNFPRLPEERMASIPAELRERFRSFNASRSGLRIRGITAGGKAVLFSKLRPRVGPPAEGSGVGARGLGPSPGGDALYLLNLETDTESVIPILTGSVIVPGLAGPQLAGGGELVVVPYLVRSGGTGGPALSLRAWDVAAGELREDWQVDSDPGRPQFEVDQQGRNVLISRSDLRTASNGGSTIQFVDTTAPQRNIKTLEIEGLVRDLALSPSGNWAAILATTGNGRSRVIVWDIVGSGLSRIVPLQMKRGELTATRNLNNNYEVGIADDDKTLLIWDHEQLVGWQLSSASQPQLALPTAGRVLQLRQVGREWITVSSGLSTEQRARGSGGPSPFGWVGSPFEIQRWSAGNGQPIGGVIPVIADVAAISPDGQTLVTSRGYQIHRWSLETMSKIGPPIDCSDRVTHIEFVADGSKFAAHLVGTARRTAGDPKRITYQRIDISMKPAPAGAGMLIYRLVPGSAAEKADLRVNDIVLRVGEQDVSTRAEFRQQVDLESGEGLTLTVQRDGAEKLVQLRPEPWPDDQLRVELDRADIGRVQVWDLRNGQPLGRLPIPIEGTVDRVPVRWSRNDRPWGAIAPDGRRVITASVFGRRTELRLFSVATGRPIRVSVEHPRPLRWVGFGPRGRLLATLDASSAIQLWDAEKLTPLGPRIQPASTVSAVTFAPDGKSLIVCERALDGPRLSQWDTSTSQRLGPSIPALNLTGLMQYSPDGQWLAAAAITHSAWLLPLPQPWTGDAERMRQLVEATTGTTMSESGDIDLLDGDRWKSQLEQLPAANERRRRFAGHTASPWDFDSFGARRSRGVGGFAGGDSEEGLEQTLEKLDQSLADSPQSGQLRFRRLDILLQLGRLDEADTEFESLLTLVDRQNLIAWLKRREEQGTRTGGFVPLLPGAAANQETSRWCLEKVLQLDPSDAGGLLQMIALRAQSGQTDEAKAIFARAMKNDGRNLILHSLPSMDVVRITAALQSFATNRSIDDEQRAAAQEAALERLAAGGEAAKHLIDWIITEQPEAWEPLMIRAEAALVEQRFDDAAADLTEVAALATRQQYEPALQTMANRATALASRSAAASTNSLERLPPRIPIWKTIIDVFPDNVYALTQMKYTCGRMADWEQAATWLGRLIQATPEKHWPRYQLAPVLLKLGQVDEYRELCRGMLEQFDESSEPLYEGRAIQACLWHAEAIDNPQRLVERMTAIFDVDPSLLHYRQTALGMAYLRSGNPTEAIEWLEKPLEPDSSATPTCEVRARAALAIAYHQNGDQAKAKEVYERAAERHATEAPKIGSEDLGSSWHDWLICDLLLEEAKLQLDRSER